MDWAQLVSTVGFPIVSFFVAGMACKYVYDKERTSLSETINKLAELTKAVEANSESIKQLVCELRGRGGED